VIGTTPLSTSQIGSLGHPVVPTLDASVRL
jgi:hypothetical protein